MRFAHPEILWLLWALPALVVVFYFARKSARRRTLMFIGSDLEQQLVIGRRDRRRMGRAALLLLVLSQLILAAARPQWGANKVEVEQKGSDVVIALDISRSMLAEDIKPSRLTRAKVELADLMDDLNGDLVGLVFFAGAAFPPVSAHRRLFGGAPLSVPSRSHHDRQSGYKYRSRHEHRSRVVPRRKGRVSSRHLGDRRGGLRRGSH